MEFQKTADSIATSTITVPDQKTFCVRGYLPTDLDSMIELFRASVRLVAQHDYTHEQLAAWAPDTIDRAAWATLYSIRQAWVAAFGDSLAGFCDMEQDGHLGMMYVHPTRQGEGVATALLEQVTAAGLQSGITRIYTEASITARPFFERRGFRIITPQTVSVRGQSFLNYRMEKFLRLA